jgi:nucleotide-binding universal stress UspA family protein
MFGIILAAIDASGQRQAVLDQSIQIAARFGAVLHVVSVNDPGQHAELRAPDPIPEVFARIEKEITDLLATARAEAEEAGVVCHTHAPGGAAAEQIIRLARELECDLIVIGHRQLSWFRRLMEDSVARDLVIEAPCSVMIVACRGCSA